MQASERLKLERIVHRHKILELLNVCQHRLSPADQKRYASMLSKPLDFEHEGRHYKIFPSMNINRFFFCYSLVINIDGVHGVFSNIEKILR